MTGRGWFFAILGLALVLKLGVNLQTIDWWYDGGYYADIARNVRDGRGFVSFISMFHAGFPSYPHPSAVYPVWPAMLGGVSRVVPLEIAAVWLPTLFYFVTVMLMWPIGRRILPGPVLPDLPTLDAGHLLMLLWALQNRFVDVTSRPYTEGLGFFLLAVAIWRWGRLVERPGFWVGVEAGLWAAGIVLVRGPFVVITGAVLMVAWGQVLWPPGPRRASLMAALGASLSAVLVAFLAQKLWFESIPGASLVTLVRFDAWAVQDGLSPVNLLGTQLPLGALIADRLSGVGIAFMLGGPHGYYLNFGYAQYAFIALGLALGLDWIRGRGGPLRARLEARRGLGLVLIVGLAQVAALQAIHKAEFAEWNFSMRHAIGTLWWFGPTLILLCQRADDWRLVGRFLLAASLGIGLMESAQRRGAIDFDRGVLAQRKAVAAWLSARQGEDPDLRVGHPDPQLIARWTQGVGFMALHTFTTPADLCRMVTRDGLDVVMLSERIGDGSEFAFVADKASFEAHFEPVDAGLPKTRVYLPKEGMCQDSLIP